MMARVVPVSGLGEEKTWHSCPCAMHMTLWRGSSSFSALSFLLFVKTVNILGREILIAARDSSHIS